MQIQHYLFCSFNKSKSATKNDAEVTLELALNLFGATCYDAANSTDDINFRNNWLTIVTNLKTSLKAL